MAKPPSAPPTTTSSRRPASARRRSSRGAGTSTTPTTSSPTTATRRRRLDGPAAAAGEPLTSKRLQAILEPALEAWIEMAEASPTAQSWTQFSGAGSAALAELAIGAGGVNLIGFNDHSHLEEVDRELVTHR